VAVDNKIIIGNLFIIPYGSKITYLFRLAVKKEYRKQGIASQLISFAQEIVKKRGITEVGLYVNAFNKELQNFYLKRGFKTSGNSYIYMWRTV
jgi:ribosomal protein S18 acetylase RimI-like enzyme